MNDQDIKNDIKKSLRIFALLAAITAVAWLLFR